MRAGSRVSAIALCSLVALGACNDDAKQEITVFAASSLTGAFTEIGKEFEESHDNVDVEFNFLSSSDLAAQIEQGSPAHVFASADEPNMERIVGGDFVPTAPAIFAHNKLTMIVPKGNPADVTSLSDLSNEELLVALCNEDCPAGRYAIEIFDKADLQVVPDSLEPDVKAVVTRVALGEADVGIAYITDAEAAGDDVEAIGIADATNVTATYLIATLNDAPREVGEFVDFVLNDSGQRILSEYGFLSK
jgi:molybdate transport system substrate-binding protein